jgi:hypothetical protein
MQSTTTDIPTTITITTRIWSAAITENFALPLLGVAFFTTYGTFATFSKLKEQERYKVIAGLLSAMVGGGYVSSLAGPEGLYFYVAGMVLGGIIWYVIDRVKKQPDSSPAQ